jgi:hypothetical protein
VLHLVSARARSGLEAFTTLPQTQKRRASESVVTASEAKRLKAAETTEPNLPVTPLTNPATPSAKMESDDEFMSGVSSQEEPYEDQESDDGSLGGSARPPVQEGFLADDVRL